MLASAQVYCPPWSALTWVRLTPDSTPEVDTATGTRLCVVMLFPSWPLPLAPQQYAAPLEPAAQVWPYPAVICMMLTPDSTPEVDTATGTRLLVVLLIPSWPFPLDPQQ